MRAEKARNPVIEGVFREVYRRGVTGIEKPLIYHGRVIGVVRDYSDYCLDLLLGCATDKVKNTPPPFKNRARFMSLSD